MGFDRMLCEISIIEFEIDSDWCKKFPVKETNSGYICEVSRSRNWLIGCFVKFPFQKTDSLNWTLQNFQLYNKVNMIEECCVKFLSTEIGSERIMYKISIKKYDSEC